MNKIVNSDVNLIETLIKISCGHTSVIVITLVDNIYIAII